MISEAVTPVVLDELDAPHTPSQPLRETASLSPELGDVQWYYRDPGGQEQGDCFSSWGKKPTLIIPRSILRDQHAAMVL